MGNTNAKLNKARQVKDNEFYTLYKDIQDYLAYYGENGYFKDKVIHLPCDDNTSNFYKYLKDNYNNFGIKEIIATAYDPNGGQITTYKDNKEEVKKVKETMSYLEEDSQNISLKADFIMSNPPFSSLGEYVPFLVNSDKDFIFLAPLTKISNVCFSEISKYVGSKYYYSRKLNLMFLRPDGSLSGVPVVWVTTLKNNGKTMRKISEIKHFRKNVNKPFDRIVNMRSPDGEDVYSCSQVIQLNSEIPGGKYVLAPITIITYDFKEDFDFVGFTNHSGVFDTWYTDDDLKKRPFIVKPDGTLKEPYNRAILKIKGR